MAIETGKVYEYRDDHLGAVLIRVTTIDRGWVTGRDIHNNSVSWTVPEEELLELEGQTYDYRSKAFGVVPVKVLYGGGGLYACELLTSSYCGDAGDQWAICVDWLWPVVEPAAPETCVCPDLLWLGHEDNCPEKGAYSRRRVVR